VVPSILLTDDIERTLSFIVERIKTKKLVLNVHPFVAAFLTKGLIPLYRKLNRKYGISLKIQAAPSYHMLEYHFYDRYENEIDLA
jgi:ribonuclease G